MEINHDNPKYDAVSQMVHHTSLYTPLWAASAVLDIPSRRHKIIRDLHTTGMQVQSPREGIEKKSRSTISHMSYITSHQVASNETWLSARLRSSKESQHLRVWIAASECKVLIRYRFDAVRSEKVCGAKPIGTFP